MRVLDVGGGATQRGRERRRTRALPVRRGRAGRSGVEPAAQLAFLSAGEASYGVRIRGLALDQGQRLQHGVVDVRSDLGPFVLADALAALGGELAQQPEQERAGHQQDADEGRADGERAGARLRECVVCGEERRHTGDDEPDAAEHHEQRPPPAEVRAVAAGVARPLRTLGLRCAPPDDQRAEERHRERQSAAAEPEAQHTEDRADDAAGDEVGHDLQLSVRRIAWPVAQQRPRDVADVTQAHPAAAIVVLGRHQKPEREVRHDADAACADHREEDPDEHDADAQVLGDAGRDAGDQPPVGTADQRRALARRRACGVLRAHAVQHHTPMSRTDPVRTLRGPGGQDPGRTRAGA